MSDPTSPTPRTPRGRLRSTLLVGTLVVLSSGLVYDFTVARPAVEAAYDRVSQRNQDFNAERKHQAMRDHDIQELLGFPPDRTFEDQGMHVEVYSWRAGLPFRSHDLYCVYRTVNGEHFFVRLTKFLHDPNRFYDGVADEGETEPVPQGAEPAEPSEPAEQPEPAEPSAPAEQPEPAEPSAPAETETPSSAASS